MRIAFVDGGTYYHHATYHDPAFTSFFCRNLYVCDMANENLDDVDCLYIASRQNEQDLISVRATLDAFLARGGMLVVMGESGLHQWLDGITWRNGVCNFWWWLEENPNSGLYLSAPDHSLFRYLTLQDCTWHHHGGVTPPPGGRSLIEAEEDGCILFDAPLGGGRVLATTLDPCYHHGSYFMPNSTKFIAGLLRWLKAGAPG
ncbi:hypothetical protein DPO11_21470 [Salmonella enterica]|nr:hypothetical protein [Salmonella enterica]